MGMFFHSSFLGPYSIRHVWQQQCRRVNAVIDNQRLSAVLLLLLLLHHNRRFRVRRSLSHYERLYKSSIQQTLPTHMTCMKITGKKKRPQVPGTVCACASETLHNICHRFPPTFIRCDLRSGNVNVCLKKKQSKKKKLNRRHAEEVGACSCCAAVAVTARHRWVAPRPLALKPGQRQTFLSGTRGQLHHSQLPKSERLLSRDFFQSPPICARYISCHGG